MKSSEPFRIMIADDHTIVREGLALLIERNVDMSVVAYAQNGLEAVEQFRQHRPDVTLMDLNMPQMDGITAVKTIRKEFPDAVILMLTTFEGEDDIYQSIQAGARGYLLKDVTHEKLAEAIRTVQAGQIYMPPPIVTKLTARVRQPVLTSREIEILQLLKEGLTNQEIAAALYIVEGTVKSHVNSILTKLEVRDRTHAVTLALRRGIIRLEK